MASSHSHWTNFCQVHLPCQVALGYVKNIHTAVGLASRRSWRLSSRCQQDSKGDGMGRRQPSVCSVLQPSEFWQPATQDLLSQSLCQQLHFPSHQFTWLNSLTFWPKGCFVGSFYIPYQQLLETTLIIWLLVRWYDMFLQNQIKNKLIISLRAQEKVSM